MDVNVTVSLIVGDVLTVCNPKWARIGMTVEDSLSNTYTVTAVDHVAFTITVTPNGAYVFTGTLLVLIRPYFFVGTPIATNKEWAKFNADERKKVPFAWMIDPTTETFMNKQDTLERESDLHMVFLDSNNTEQWATTDTHDNRLQAIYNMVDEFVETIRRNPLFFSDELEYTTKNFTKFGKETSEGMVANIIDANLTGVDLRLTLPVNDRGECKC